MFFVLVIVALALPALAVAPFVGAQEDSAPYWPTESWRTSTPEEQGMDSEKLTRFLSLLKLGYGFHSMLVIRHGYVVLDASMYPFHPDQPHALYSGTKSVVSTLAGIAIDKGYIQSADQSIWDFFPKEATANIDARKEAITLKHLLTQSSGLGLGFPEDIGMYMLTADDQPWAQYVLDHPMTVDPGAEFNYLDANAHLVSAIVTKATGMSAFEFAQPNLFEPLGITDVIWVTDPQGISRGGDNSYMSPYSMAKLGYLYLRNGEWDGQQILPPSWIEQASTAYMQPESWPGGYGFLWWTRAFCGVPCDKSYNGYAAIGLGGQEIWVIPDLDLVVVLTADLAFRGPDLINSYILPAVQSDTALPDNPEALTKLTSEVDALSNPAPSAVENLPDTAQQHTGQVYVLAENELGWKSIGLEFQDQEIVLKLDAADFHLELPVGLDGIDRISSAGLPPDSVWWPLADVPLALHGSWLSSSTFLVYMRDLRGMLDFEISITFGKTLIMTVTPRLPLLSAVWQKPAISIRGTLQ
jgi:CubicO group peptidase (beta-lactamase class C family)